MRLRLWLVLGLGSGIEVDRTPMFAITPRSYTTCPVDPKEQRQLERVTTATDLIETV